MSVLRWYTFILCIIITLRRAQRRSCVFASMCVAMREKGVPSQLRLVVVDVEACLPRCHIQYEWMYCVAIPRNKTTHNFLVTQTHKIIAMHWCRPRKKKTRQTVRSSQTDRKLPENYNNKNGTRQESKMRREQKTNNKNRRLYRISLEERMLQFCNIV